MTSTVKVSWSNGGALQTVWEKGKAATESGHAEIVQLLKGAQ